MPAETDVEQGPLERPEVLQLVRDRLADILEIEPSSIAEDGLPGWVAPALIAGLFAIAGGAAYLRRRAA